MKKNKTIPITIKSGQRIKLNSDVEQNQSPLKKKINPQKEKGRFHILSIFLKITGLIFLILIIFASVLFFGLLKICRDRKVLLRMK